MESINRISKKKELIAYYQAHLKTIRLNKYVERGKDISKLAAKEVAPVKSKQSSLANPVQQMPVQSKGISGPVGGSGIMTSATNFLPIVESPIQVNSRHISSTPLPQQLPKSPEVWKILENRNEIKDFYEIVLSVNIDWNFRKNGKYWTQVSQNVNQSVISRAQKSGVSDPAIICNHLFYKWSAYYAQVFNCCLCFHINFQ